MNVQFSVVMTLYESWTLLPRAIACLMNQSVRDWELLLVCDGQAPEDRFVPQRILEPLMQRYPDNRIEYFELPRAEGCWGNVSRAYGLQKARGEYICWVNHDNLISPCFLQAHRNNIRKQPGCLSVVDIDLWQHDRYRGKYPRGYRCGKVDLLCFALPCETARQLDAFGPSQQTIYAADGRLFDAAARLLPIQHSRRIAGVHF